MIHCHVFFPIEENINAKRCTNVIIVLEYMVSCVIDWIKVYRGIIHKLLHITGIYRVVHLRNLMSESFHAFFFLRYKNRFLTCLH